ncbi:MAG: oligosaccharide flippase family protein, partial [bacterium]
MMKDESIRNSVLGGLFWKFSERIGAQLITFIVSITLARLLTPEEFGVIAIVIVFITIANVFVESSFGNALIQKKDADNLDFSSVFFFNIGFSLVLYILIYFLAPYIATFYNMDILSPVLRVLALRIPFAGINSVQHAYVARH